MRVYLSVDMEGIAGVSHPKPTHRGDLGYPAAAALMTAEANAAIEGAFDGGATSVLVNDSHGGMYNLVPDDLDPRARLLQGQKAWSMVAGAGPLGDAEEPRYDVALFVGYHARAGHPSGTIAHTFSSKPVETRLNGRPTGEYGLNALVLGAWGVPVGLVAGGCPGPNGSSSRTRTERAPQPPSIRPGRASSSGPGRGEPSGAQPRASFGSSCPTRRSRSTSSTGAGWRPTTPRSRRSGSGSAIGSRGSSRRTRSPPIAASWPGSASPDWSMTDRAVAR
jgi:D-aminopeptidase-like protein